MPSFLIEIEKKSHFKPKKWVSFTKLEMKTERRNNDTGI